MSLEKFFSAAEGGHGLLRRRLRLGHGATSCYDNAKVTGWHTGYPDTHARVDLSTGAHHPLGAGHRGVPAGLREPRTARPSSLARGSCSRRWAGARGRWASCRSSARSTSTSSSRRRRSRLQEKGFQNLTPLTPGMFGYSWLRTLAERARWCTRSSTGATPSGSTMEGMHTETGPGVYETAIRYDDLEQAADKAALFKTVVKEICARHGVTACFMAKANAKLPGCSGHVHQSLWTLTGEPRTSSTTPARRDGMSRTLRHYIGGQVELMPELTALYWPTINSYKRSVENTWAPTTATWGRENRTTRDPRHRRQRQGMRIEYRQLGADMNAYIGMARQPGRGAVGHRERDRAAAARARATATRRKAKPLPRNLQDAVALLEGVSSGRGRSSATGSWTTTCARASGKCVSTSARSPTGSWSGTWSSSDPRGRHACRHDALSTCH